jgi:hypothetical protein
VPGAVHYLPILTTVVAAVFATDVLRRYRERGGTHLLWWGIGLVTYGAGTATESLTTLFGWSEPVFRTWYVTGALLGGAPLAQGSVYLLLPRRAAHWMTAALLAAIVFGTVAVALTPLNHALVETHRLSGRVIEWQWVRMISPFINLYAVIFLIGGALISAYRFAGDPATRHRFIGNVLIAIGAILPGIGGTATRMGYVEVLYMTELVGLLLIYAGYRRVVGGRGAEVGVAIPAAQ